MVVDFLVSEYLLTLICFTQNKFKGRTERLVVELRWRWIDWFDVVFI